MPATAAWGIDAVAQAKVNVITDWCILLCCGRQIHHCWRRMALLQLRVDVTSCVPTQAAYVLQWGGVPAYDIRFIRARGSGPVLCIRGALRPGPRFYSKSPRWNVGALTLASAFARARQGLARTTTRVESPALGRPSASRRKSASAGKNRLKAKSSCKPWSLHPCASRHQRALIDRGMRLSDKIATLFGRNVRAFVLQTFAGAAASYASRSPSAPTWTLAENSQDPQPNCVSVGGVASRRLCRDHVPSTSLGDTLRSRRGRVQQWQ